MERYFADIMRCVAFCNTFIITKALNGFLMTQRQMTLKDVCGYIMLENFIDGRFLGWCCRYDL